jgi:cytochrome c2
MRRFLFAAIFAAAVAGGAIVIALAIFGDESKPVIDVPGGNADRGRELIEHYGCGSCHTIAGVHSTSKYIGPPLKNFAERRFIAGEVPNTLENLLRWIQNPKAIEPGTIMPNLGVKPQEARDIAAYLYSH